MWTGTPVRSGRAALALVAAAFAVAALPLLIAGPVPAMSDYPNHLARIAILAAGVGRSANPYYREAWGFFPNLAMDLIAPPLARVIGARAATWLFLLAAQAIVVAGAATLGWVVKGRTALAGCTAALMLYSFPFAWGFINFEFAFGLALFALAAWIALLGRPAWLRYGVHALACMVLFAGHLFALGLYGWAVGLYEAWRWRTARQPMWRLFATGLLLAAPALALIAGWRPSGASSPGATRWDPMTKILWLLQVSGYSWRLSALISAMLISLILVLFRLRRVRFVDAGWTLAAGFAVLYLAMPHRLLDVEFVDVRVVTAGVLILSAFAMLEPLSMPLRRLAVGVVFTAAALDFADVAYAQASYRGEYARLTASFSRLPPHARVLIGYSPVPGEAPPNLMSYPIYHAPVMAAAFAGAFVPTLFASAGKQPLVARPDMEPIDNSNGPDAPEAVLVDVAGRRPVPSSYRFVQAWPRDFDDLYLVGHPGADPLPGLLQPLARGERFALYRIVKPAPQSASR